jgi:hypothetical protein
LKQKTLNNDKMKIENENSYNQQNPQLNIGAVSCRIYYVAGKLDKMGFSHRIEPIDCEETKKMYVTHSKRINKDKIMKIDTQIIESHRWQHFFTYCLEGQQQEALNMLKTHIIEKVKKIKSEVDELYKWLP